MPDGVAVEARYSNPKVLRQRVEVATFCRQGVDEQDPSPIPSLSMVRGRRDWAWGRRAR
jgi:hypothetical protein